MSSPKKPDTYRELFLRIEAAVNDPDSLRQLEDDVRVHPQLDRQQREELQDRGRQYLIDIARADQDPAPTSGASLRSHIEKYANLIWKEPQPGNFQLIFLGRKPTGTEDDSGSNPPTDDS